MLKGAVRRFLPYKEGHGIGGTSMDFYADMGIPFTYTVELPDFGQYGMLIPSSMISTVWANIEKTTFHAHCTSWKYTSFHWFNMTIKGKIVSFRLETEYIQV